MDRRKTDEGMVQKLTSGEYVIDVDAVAEAMLNHVAGGQLPRSSMLVASQVTNGRPVATDENRPAAGPHLP
jgi:hypothetical protein